MKGGTFLSKKGYAEMKQQIETDFTPFHISNADP